MTLWNLIRDFLVQHIFGGVTSTGLEINNSIGNLYYSNSLDTEQRGANDLFFQITNIDWSNDSISPVSISLGDWLSTTFTVITLILLVFFLYIFVKWIFKLFSGLLH